MREDIWLYLCNFAIFLISLTNIEVLLKIILLLISIDYTLHKWIKNGTDKREY